MEALRESVPLGQFEGIPCSDILTQAMKTEVFEDAHLREQDRNWSERIDVEECISADASECEDMLKTFAERGLFFCYAKLMSALVGKIPAEVWARRISQDVGMEDDEAQRLSDFIFQRSHKKLLVFYEDVWLLGGIERVVSVLLNGLKDEYRLLLVTSKKKNEECPEGFPIPQEALHVHLLWTPRIPLYLQVATICLAMNAAMLIGNPNIEQMFMPVYGELKGTGVKTIAVNHYFYYLPFQYKPLRHVESVRRKTLNAADSVVWLTRFSAACAADLNENTVYIPNPNTFSRMPARTVPKEKIVMAVGRFYDPLKRIDRVLSIFKKVLEKEPDAKLWLVGQYNGRMVIPGTKGKRLGKLFYELNLPEESVVFWGPQKNVLDFYLKSAVLLFPSECEGYGMVVKEAGVAGTPVVVNDFPGSEDIVEQGKNGYRINMYQGDTDEAAECIACLLNDKQKWLEMSENSQKLADTTNTETVILKWKQVIESTLRAKNPEEFKNELLEAGVLLDYDDKNDCYLRATRFLEQLFAVEKPKEKKTLYFCLLDVFYYLRGVVIRTRYLLNEIGFRRTCIRLVNKCKRKLRSVSSGVIRKSI